MGSEGSNEPKLEQPIPERERVHTTAPAQAGAGVHAIGENTRGRKAIAEASKEPVRQKTQRELLADHYMAKYEREQAEKKAREEREAVTPAKSRCTACRRQSCR